MKKLLIVLLFPLFISIPTFAEERSTQSQNQETEETKIKEIVVTASRYEKKKSSIPANVIVITAEDIKNSTAQTIPDILKNQAGIHVKDITGNRRSLSVDLRGFGETASLNTLVLIDGRRVNQADLSGVDWLQIPLEAVEKIEIIKGGRGSVFYGDNATGGVINIITKKGSGLLKKGLTLQGGSYDTFDSSGYVSGSYKDLSYNLSGNYLTSNSYRKNSDTNAKDLGMRLNYYLNDFIELNLSSGYHKDKTGLPGALRESSLAAGTPRTNAANPNDFADIEDFYFKGGPEIYFWDNSFFKIDASFRQRNSLSFASFSGGSFTGNTEIQTVAVSPRILIKNKIMGLNNSFSTGFDLENTKEDIVNDSIFFGSQTLGTFKLKKNNYGFYVHNDIALLGNLFLSGGYRFDKADFDFAPSTPNRISHEKNLFTAGINYNFYKKSYTYFSFSKGFRYPVLDEIFSFFTNTINTNLTPQSSYNYEFGIKHFFSDELNAQINFFRIETHDEIFFNPTSFANENLDGMTRRDGVEISFGAKVSKILALNGSYTYLNARIKGGQFKGNDFPGVAKQKVTLQSLFSFNNRFSFTLSGNYIGTQPFISDFSNSLTNQDDYFVMNAKLKYNWKVLTAFLNINNITNQEYSEYGVLGSFPKEKAFYPSPKINFLFGLSADF